MQVSTQYFNINLTKFGQTNVKGENIFPFKFGIECHFFKPQEIGM